MRLHRASGVRRLAVYPPFRHRVVHEKGGNGAAHVLSRAGRVEDGDKAGEYAEGAGLGGAKAGGVETPGGELDAGHTEHRGMAGRRRAVQSEEARALEVSRYAREIEVRAIAGVGMETAGSQ